MTIQILRKRLIDLNAQVIEAYQQPTVEDYQQVQVFQQRQAIVVGTFPEQQFEITQLLR